MLKRLITLAQALPEQSLYHYTKCSGVQGILAGQRLHATKSDFLNDVSEMDTVRNVTREVLETIEPPQAKALLISHLLPEESAHTGRTYYVVSFSTNPDSITLWSEFGDATGYNISFAGQNMTRRLEKAQHIAWHGFVIYAPAQQREIIRELLLKRLPNELHTTFAAVCAQGSIDPNGKLFRTFCDAFQKAAGVYALFFKQAEFEAEAEYRFAIKQESGMEIHYREKDGFIVPYLRIDLSEKHQLLPIESITVAPKNHIDLAQHGMQMYLEQLGYHVPIRLSRIKLRY